MKNKILLASSILLGACATNSKTALVQQSELCITTPDERIVWIKAEEHGHMLYKNWEDGVFGPAEVHLVPVDKFEKMEAWATSKKK